MKIAALIFYFLIQAISPLSAQKPQNIRTGQTISGFVTGGDTTVYTLELKAGQFAWGDLVQYDTDIEVLVKDDEMNRITSSINPTSIDEFFQIETEKDGFIYIHIFSVDSTSGEYDLTIGGVENIAEKPDLRVDQIMKEFDRNAPGAVVGVYKDGQLLFTKGYGLANLDYDIPYSPETRTNIGSTSKQFTCFGLMLLVDDGLIDLDSSIQTYLPNVKKFDKKVTVRNLMTHTSGYREFLNLILLTGRKISAGSNIERHELIEIINRQPELQNEPGGEWNYNNTAFGLLTMIIENVSGMDFVDYMNERVFEPLGMINTQFRENQNVIIKQRAAGYSIDNDGYFEVRDLGGAMGAGAVYTTTTDMMNWFRNFKTYKVGSEDIFNQMTTPFVLNNGEETGYGFGLIADEYKGLRQIHHGGADIAHRSEFTYFPDIDAGVVVFSNYAPFNSSKYADLIADTYFKEYYKEEDESKETFDFDSSSFSFEDFEVYEGTFELDAVPGFQLKFFQEDSSYYTQATNQQKIEIEPTGKNQFTLAAVDARIVFEKDEETGEFDSLILYQNGEQKASRVKERPWEPTIEELDSYAGIYYSEEIETKYYIQIIDTSLSLRIAQFGDKYDLHSGKKDEFILSGLPGYNLMFQKNDENKVISILVNAGGRSRDIRFTRQFYE
tara:strand:- start:230 stop:2230 length:2001 start_codon:yes stop_codon:yes gene_type:complete